MRIEAHYFYKTDVYKKKKNTSLHVMQHYFYVCEWLWQFVDSRWTPWSDFRNKAVDVLYFVRGKIKDIY